MGTEGVDANWAELAAEGMTLLPGDEPGTALRVRVESCSRGGCVHLEQMAYSATVGWYRQKAFTVPQSMVGDLSRVLKMCNCLLPPAPKAGCGAAAGDTLSFAAAQQTPPTHHEPGRRSG